MSIFHLMGNEPQNAIVRQALSLCDFPWDRMLPELQKEAGRSAIPVEWADLSRWSAKLAEAKATSGHLHVHEDGDTGHAIDYRNRVLGLAWYSGKISLDISMISNPALAREVFLSEGAHMVDFFYMTQQERDWLSAHWDPADSPAIDWFDVGPYETWMGEAFMGLFCASFAPGVPVTLTQFTHAVTPQLAQDTRKMLLRQSPPPDLKAPPAPPAPAEPFPYEPLDYWASRERRWWSRYSRNAAQAYKNWRSAS